MSTPTIADLKIAVSGPGAIATMHAEAMRQLGAKIAAAAGPRVDDLDEFCGMFDVTGRYPTMEEMLAAEQPDVVFVTAPSPVHAAQTRLAIESGAHVFCEIPAATSAADAIEVASLASERGRTVTVGHTLRFWGPHLAVAREIEAGFEVSHVVIRSTQLRQTDHGWTGKKRDWTDDVLWHHSGHVVDAALWFLGAAAEGAGDSRVAASVARPWTGTGTVMDVSISLEAPAGGLASISLSYHSRRSTSDYLLIGPERTLTIDDGGVVRSYDERDEPSVLFDGGGEPKVQRNAVDAQDREFLEAIVEGRKARFTIDDVIPAMKVLQSVADLATG